MLHPLFGAELGGMSLKDGCSPAVAGEIRSALHRYGVVAFRGQPLTDPELQKFGTALGDPYSPSMAVPEGEAPNVFRLANVDAAGNILPANDRIRGVVLSNQLWHTDSTYLPRRAEFSLLASRTIPPEGGDTQFCDTRIAFETMPPALQLHAESLNAWHSIVHSRALTGFTRLDGG